MTRKALGMALVAALVLLVAGGMALVVGRAGRDVQTLDAQQPTADDTASVTVVNDDGTASVSQEPIADGDGVETFAEDASEADGEPIELRGISYDDIPEPSRITGDYTVDTVKQAIAEYMHESYPARTITSIQLLGNNTAPSQEKDEMTSYMCYLVTLDGQTDVGLFIKCSDSTPPEVAEDKYLVIDSTLLYDVDNRSYIPMNP